MLMPWARASALESPTLSPLVHATRSSDGSGAFEDGFEECCLAALERADDGDASWALGFSAVGGHESLLPCPEKRDLGRRVGRNALPLASVGKVPRQNKTAGLVPGRLNSRGEMALVAGAQFEFADAEREVEAGLAADREGLKRDRAVVAADEHIGPETRADGRLGGCAHIAPRKRAAQRGCPRTGQPI